MALTQSKPAGMELRMACSSVSSNLPMDVKIKLHDPVSKGRRGDLQEDGIELDLGGLTRTVMYPPCKKIPFHHVIFCRSSESASKSAHSPSDIDLMLHNYQRAREEAKMEISKARDRLRERTEQEKLRIREQIISHLLRVRNVVTSGLTGADLETGVALTVAV